MRAHNQSLDIWKGISIICVIGIHVSGVAFSFPADSPNEWSGIFYRDLFDFAVALFMAISGFLSPTAAEIDRSGIGKYYKSRLSRLWPPYLIWTAIYLAVGSPSSFLSIKSLAKAVFLGQGIGIGYFVIALTSLVFLHPFLVKISRNAFIVLSALLSLLTIGAAYYARIEFPGSLLGRFPYYALPFSAWIVFYATGFCLKDHKASKKGFLMFVISVISCLLLSAIESIYLLKLTGDGLFASSQVKLSNCLLSIVLIRFVLTYEFNFSSAANVFSWLGKKSYVIYLSHLLIVNAFSMTIPVGNGIYSQQWLYIPLATIVVTALVSLCVYFAELLLPDRLCIWILGVRKGNSPAGIRSLFANRGD